MEILVKGVLPAREQLIGRCEICGCVVKFNTTEGRRNPDRDDDKPFHGTTYELECPTYGCRGSILRKNLWWVVNMKKFKITVETKSRSKVVIDFENTKSKEELYAIFSDIYAGTTIWIKDTFFNSSNVNYIEIKEVK